MKIKRYKEIRRLQQIVSVLIKYGFGWLVREMRVFPYASYVERLFLFNSKKNRMELSPPERLRKVLEELGPTFIKLGQVVSTRADLLPPEWLKEFSKLQDMVPSGSFEDVSKVVEGSLNAGIGERFSCFDEKPVASASIAQVHYAKLKDGTPVAVKIKRPHIGRIIESDISVMFTVAGLLDRYVEQARRYRPVEVVDEFSRIIRKEQDFLLEGSNAGRFSRIFEMDPTVIVPRVYPEYTTRDILTMERLEGIPFDEVERIKKAGHDIKRISENATKAFFKQVFEHGIFHADLHPGNIFVGEKGAIIYLDFGIVGRLDRRLRRYLAGMLYCLVKQDYYGMAIIHRDMGLISADVDIMEFEDALRDITEPLFGRSLEEIDVSGLIMQLIRTAKRFKMKLQPNLLLLQKAMIIIEGIGRQLAPETNMWRSAKPLIYRWMIKEKVSPRRVYERERERISEIVDVAASAPAQLSRLMNKVLDNEVKVGFVHHRLEDLTNEIGDLGKRMGRGMIVASLVIGSSIIIAFSEWKNPSYLLPWLGVGGFMLAMLLLFGFIVGERGGGKE